MVFGQVLGILGEKSFDMQGVKGVFRRQDNKLVGRMLASQPITFPKRHIANTKCDVISPN